MSLSKKLDKQNVSVLALPLYGRTSPKLDLAYSKEGLNLDSYHKNQPLPKILLKMFLQL